MPLNRYLALVEEDTYATLPGTPSWTYFDISSGDISGPDDQANMYESVGAMAPRIQTPGVYIPSGTIALPVDDDNFGWLLKGLFGNISSAEISTSGFYTHTFTPAEKSLPSFVLAIGKDEFEHQFLGSQINELTLELEDKLLVASIGITAAKDSDATLQDITTADFPSFVYNSLVATITKNATDVSARVEDMTLTIGRNLNAEDGVPVNSRFPTSGAFPETLEASAELTLSFDGKTELEEYWGGAGGPQDSLTEMDCILDFAETTDEKELTFTLPRCIMQSHGAPVETRGRIEQTVTLAALHDSSAGHSIQAELVNGTTDTGYGQGA